MQNTPWGMHTVLQKPLQPVEPTQESVDIYCIYGLDLEALCINVRPNLTDSFLLDAAWKLMKDEGRASSTAGLVRRKSAPHHEASVNSFVAEVTEPVRACVTVTVTVDDTKRRIVHLDFEYREEVLSYLGSGDAIDQTQGQRGLTGMLNNLNPLHDGNSVPLRTELYQSIASAVKAGFVRENLVFSASNRADCSTEIFLSRPYREALKEISAVEAEDEIQSVLETQTKRARVFERDTSTIIKQLRNVIRDAQFYPPPPRLFRGDIPRPKMFTSAGELVTTLGTCDRKFETNHSTPLTPETANCSTILQFDEEYRTWLKRAVATTTVATTDAVEAAVTLLEEQHILYRHKLLYWLENRECLQDNKAAVQFRKKYRFAAEIPLCEFKCNRFKKAVAVPIPIPDKLVLSPRYVSFAASAFGAPIRIHTVDIQSVEMTSSPMYRDSGINITDGKGDVYVFGNVKDRDDCVLLIKTLQLYTRVVTDDGFDPLGASEPEPVPIAVQVVIEDAYENQRFYPFKGWSSELLPGERPSFSDITGKVKRSLENMDLPGPATEWEWSEGWKLDMSSGLQGPSIDDQGWEYAVNFTSSHWSNGKEWSDCVRRRRWVRGCHIKDMLPRNLPSERNPTTSNSNSNTNDTVSSQSTARQGDLGSGDTVASSQAESTPTSLGRPSDASKPIMIVRRKPGVSGSLEAQQERDAVAALSSSLGHDSPADAVNALVNEDEAVVESNMPDRHPPPAPLTQEANPANTTATTATTTTTTTATSTTPTIDTFSRVDQAKGSDVNGNASSTKTAAGDSAPSTAAHDGSIPDTAHGRIDQVSTPVSTRTTTPPPIESPPSSDNSSASDTDDEDDDTASAVAGSSASGRTRRGAPVRTTSGHSRATVGSESDSDDFYDAAESLS